MKCVSWAKSSVHIISSSHSKHRKHRKPQARKPQANQPALRLPVPRRLFTSSTVIASPPSFIVTFALRLRRMHV